MSSPRRPSVLALGLAVTLAVTLCTPTRTARADDPDAGKRAEHAPSVHSRAERVADAAVAQVRDIAGGRREGDLTMALREVANNRLTLSGVKRAEAEALLRRPTDSGGDGVGLDYTVAEREPLCSPDICVHSVATTADRAAPQFVQQTLDTLTRIHDDYLLAGYREPRPDAGRGGDDRIDVYLGDIGGRGIYGYCTSDQPEPDPTPSTWDRWAYCTLDNDFSPQQFPSHTPLENLQVTAAHEYFHATQYAYDRYEDAWLLEATAAWVEDEMYDAIDDNLQYLRTSPITRPRTPLDTFNGTTGFHYGTWSFTRFLTERFRARQGRLPRLVLDIFRKADGARGGPDQYSWQAVNTVLRAKRTTAAKMLGSYAVANRRPAQTYDEGRVNRYPTAPLARRFSVTPAARPRFTTRLAHLTSSTVRLRPSRLSAAGWRLQLRLDLAPRYRGSSALVTSATKDGRTTTRRIFLDKQGDGAKRVPFSSGTVAWVEVTLVNGSARFDCFSGGAYSCSGRSPDDGLPAVLTADAVR